MEGRLSATGPDPVPISDAGDALRTALADPAYVAVQAYIASTPETDARLGRLSAAISKRTNRYTTIGYGPRFLHSTGQLHKGGPAGGAFLQILDDPKLELEVPETDFTFNALVAAQAAGDRAALTDRGRIVVAVDVGDDPATIDAIIAGVVAD